MDDDSPVTPGVTVEAEVVDAEDNSETTLPVSYSGGDGSKALIWQKFVGTNGVSGFSVRDQIKVVPTIDGGTPEAQTKVVT